MFLPNYPISMCVSLQLINALITILKLSAQNKMCECFESDSGSIPIMATMLLFTFNHKFLVCTRLQPKWISKNDNLNMSRYMVHLESEPE